MKIVQNVSMASNLTIPDLIEVDESTEEQIKVI